ncbi:plasmid partitioning protein RepB [Mesorhizobium sp. CAU 1732]|uniref:plasmid partitioning protein RepB n=1 Tax=Mesorhizobium sp. CAU 1732 TaxID=3140358 RepID=UPI0032617FF9
MNARKDRLRSLFGGEVPEGSPDDPNPVPVTPPEPPQKRSTSGAVKAMGLSLGTLSQEVEEARKLRDVLASGDQVVELDTALIERSPYVDRLSEGAKNDGDFDALKASIEEHGQQVPVLVRPHPDADKAARGFYQLAYGHRRAQAMRELGRPVRAVVRALDDNALVMAQGKENAERRALSFIERAFFAKTLIDHGFDRATAQAALAVHKSEMSRLLQVAEAIPIPVVRAIGPAPKAGRPRWVMLGQLLAMDAGGLALQELRSEAFRAAGSDTRFQRLYARLERSARNRVLKAKPGPRQIADGRGRAIAELARTAHAARLTIPDSAGEGFADYIAARLPELYAAFRYADEAQDKDKN